MNGRGGRRVNDLVPPLKPPVRQEVNLVNREKDIRGEHNLCEGWASGPPRAVEQGFQLFECPRLLQQCPEKAGNREYRFAETNVLMR